MTNQQRIAIQLLQAIGYKRRKVAQARLSSFISLYLQALAEYSRPTFHDEMIARLQGMVGGVGVGGPRAGVVHNQEAATQFFAEKSSQEGITSYKRLLFMAPRGFAKSTICSVAFPLWLALYGKKKDIFIVSATMAVAAEQLRKIKAEVERNERILNDFGEVKAEKWTEEMIVFRNGSTIRAKGKGFAIRGFRPDMIICDDLEDEESLNSKEQRDKLETWFFRTLLPSLKPDQSLVYVGTNQHQLSLIDKLSKKPEFFAKTYRALDDGKSIWESMWPTERLTAMRRELGEYAFQAEYMNNPISLQEQLIKPHFIDGVKVGDKYDLTCLAIDPAVSTKESSDLRAFVLMGRTGDGKFREIYSEAGRWEVTEQIDRIIDIYQRYKPNRLIVESVAFQKVYKNQLIECARKRKIWLPVSEAVLGTRTDGRPRDKRTRLMQVVHLFEQQIVEIVNPELREQLLVFPEGDHDDLVDACVFSLYWLMKYQAGKTMISKEEVKVVDARKAYFVDEIRPGVFVTKVGEPPIKRKRSFLSLKWHD